MVWALLAILQGDSTRGPEWFGRRWCPTRAIPHESKSGLGVAGTPHKSASDASGRDIKIKEINPLFFVQLSSYIPSLKVSIFGNLRGGALPEPRKVAPLRSATGLYHWSRSVF